jgi:hypothetical protein
MFVGERELYQRFIGYDDEELFRILTVERAQYRNEALAAAERVLMQRGMNPSLVPAAPSARAAQMSPPAAGGQARPKRPYQLVDLFMDALFFTFLYWVTSEMDSGSVLPESWLADGAVRLLFIASLTLIVMYLRQVWRTKKW